MQPVNLGGLARAAEAHIQGEGLPKEIQAVGTDTRSLPPGSLFVALRGERFDGHKFLQQAANAGAVAALVDQEGVPENSPLPLLVVDNTLSALAAVARFVRRTHAGPTVGVTGSNGKTTTKEMIAAALSSRGPVHKTKANLNNRIGVPLTIFDWEQEWAAVIEMGMNESGEIRELAKIAEPRVGVITVVGPAHIETLGTQENIARAKGELFEAMSEDAIAIVNLDDPLITSVSTQGLKGQRTIGFGWSEHADVRVVRVTSEDDTLVVDFEVDGDQVRSRLPFPGEHNATNAAAAIATAYSLDVAVGEAVAALEQTKLPGSRLVIRRDLPFDVSVLDDSYNANPQSVSAALETLATVATGRRLAALGDMYELGKHAPHLHREIGLRAAETGVSWVFSLGRYAEDVAEGAREGGSRAAAFESIDELTDALNSEMRAGDWLLVKGSRSMKMEQVVEYLERRA